MKSIISIPFGILSAILFCACSSDSGETLLAVAYTPPLKSLSSDTVTIGNKDNPYDDIGLQYRNLLSAYKDGNYSPDTYTDILNVVEVLTNSSLPPQTDSPTRDLLALCMNNSEAAINLIVQQSALSQNGRGIVSEFIANYEDLGMQPFSSAYSEIVAIEAYVSSSVTLPDFDKRVILSVTSITRYSLYHSCCEDTDWKKSVGNIVAALAGAIETNTSRSIQYPLTTSIAGLEKVQF